MRPGLHALTSRLSGRTGSLREVRGALAGSVVVSFTGQLLLAVSGVLVARLLGPEDRGKLALVILVPVVVVQLATLGAPLAVTYFTATGASPQRLLRRLRGPIATQALVGCAVSGLAFATLAFADTLREGEAAVAAVAALPGMLLIGYGVATLQGTRHFRAFNILRQAPAALYVVGVIGLYVADVDSVLAVTVAWSASCIAVGLLAIGLAWRARGGTDEPPRLKRFFDFGLRGLVGASSPVEAYRLDQLAIGIFLAPLSLGLYVVGLAFTNLPQFIAQSVGMVAYPHLAGMRNRADAWRAIKEYALATSALCLVVCAVLIILAERLIVLFFGEAFASATDVTRVLLVGAAVVSVRRLLGDAARGMGMPGAASIAEVAAWIVLVPALALFLPLWGLVGVAVALTVSYAASLVLLVALIARHRRHDGGEAVTEPDPTMSFAPEA
jgi:O-antigen/teichoic acid export membrane protein